MGKRRAARPKPKAPPRRAPPANPAALGQAAVQAVVAGRIEEAKGLFERGLKLEPKNPSLLHGLGVCLLQLGRPAEAVEPIIEAHLQRPDNTEILQNLCYVLVQLWRLERAIELLHRLLELEPDRVPAMNLLGSTLSLMGRHAEASPWLERAEARDPGGRERRGPLLQSRAALCRWDDREVEHAALTARLESDLEWGKKPSSPPFEAIMLGLDAGLIRRLGEAHVPKVTPLPKLRVEARQRLRIGYLSPDLHNHPVGLLMAPILEAHDRERFDVRIYGLRTIDDPVRARIERAVDAVVRLDDLPDAEVTRHIAADGLDVLVDLVGFTNAGRPGVLARRPARVQAHFLGYPGSLGARAVDYQILHASRLGPSGAADYGEALALLPETFIASEGFAEPERIPTRAELGLPEDGFVFGFFGAAYRIEPRVFDAWMGLLREVEGSVLWMQNGDAPARDNLRAEAERRGVAGDRLRFCEWGLLSQTWIHTRCDLWLDGWHVSSGTASIVAVWTGTPLLTLAGATPQSRTGAGVLTGAQLPELVAESEEDYAARALAFARDPASLTALRERMLSERCEMPLFRPEDFTRQLERAYVHMVERDREGGAPESFELS